MQFLKYSAAVAAIMAATGAMAGDTIFGQVNDDHSNNAAAAAAAASSAVGYGGAGGQGGSSTAYGGAGGSAYQQQGQQQGQIQGQAQGQTQDASNRNSVYVQGDKSYSSVVVEGDAAAEIPVSSAYAPGLAAGADTCMGSSSLGGAAMDFGFSVGSTWRDDDCGHRRNIATLVGIAGAEAGVAYACLHMPDMAAALGPRCPRPAAPASVPAPASASFGSALSFLGAPGDGAVQGHKQRFHD